MKDFTRKLFSFFSSNYFFYAVVTFFVLQALWFVFSAVYPMAFDEDFHVGVISLYANQWSPFLVDHPMGADQFGAVARDPSYLFHYVMSFPYRLISLFTHDTVGHVIILRLINVALFSYGLILFRRVMLRAKVSSALTHVSLAIFTLIPIVPQLAAHINYDNVLMVLLPAMCLLVFSLVEGFRLREIRAQALLGLVLLCLLMSVVKYAALPFIIAAVVFVVSVGWVYFAQHRDLVISSFSKTYKAIALPAKIALFAGLIIGCALFTERYVVNMVDYKTPVPDCGQVLSTEQCMAYGPWGRDYSLEQLKPADFTAPVLTYMEEWFKGMWFRMFFAVNGPVSEYTNYPPLPVPSRTAIVIAIMGLIAVILSWKQLVRNNFYTLFFVLLIALYSIILWFDQYDMYRATAEPVAINARYLLPILPLVAAVIGRAISLVLTRYRWNELKPWLAAAVIILFLHGGGVFTFILRSDHSWNWPYPAVQSVNDTARNVLAPITIEGSKYY